MMFDPGQADRVATVPPEEDLPVRLENPLPASLPVGCATAIFCYGTCFHRHEAVEDLAIVVDGVRHPPAAMRMPRLDVFQMLHPEPLLEASGSGPRDLASSEDPEVRAYRGGFWATVPIQARDRPGTVELGVAVRLPSGAELVAALGSIEVVEREPRPAYEGLPHRTGPGLIAICMATFEPNIALFRVQIESLRSQTDERWICLISDDCSSPERFEQIRQTVEGDSRFLVSHSSTRLGFYRNFERALTMIPAEAELVALCDQDDRWHPEKLEMLRGALADALLVYSDQRLVDADGRVLRDTLWKGRRNNYTNLASMLVANTVTGAATLFRREVAEMSLPFPEAPGLQFHDHWLGLVALAMGEVAYVDRPLYDYVQHTEAILGKVEGDTERSTATAGGGRSRWSVRELRERLAGWRSAYFWGYAGRVVQAQTLLARCSERLTGRKRRALTRFIASERSPLAFGWLVSRSLRFLWGRNETLGSEVELAQGILWRWIVSIRAVRLRSPSRRAPDTRYPLDQSFEQKRLRRWRAGA